MKVAPFGLLSLCLGGCGSFFSADISGGGRIYGGVRFDAQAVYEKPLLIFVVPLDLPFSFAFDTVVLPWSIISAIQNGEPRLRWIFPDEKTQTTWKTQETGVVEGYVTEAEDPGFEVIPIGKWPPPDLHPLPDARVRAFDKNEVSVVNRETNENGHYQLAGDWETPWKTIVVEKEGYDPVRIPVISLVHSPAERGYWEKHRLLVRIARKR